MKLEAGGLALTKHFPKQAQTCGKMFFSEL